jgi:hypothetical protein
MMRRRLLAISCAVGMAVALMAQPASAATILVFGQSGGGNLFMANETGGTTVLSANNIPVEITTLNELAVDIDAFFTLVATSGGNPAVNVPGTNAWAQPYSGSFSITGIGPMTGFNYLSGTFSGLALANVGGTNAIVTAAQPPLTLSFTSSVPGMPLDIPRAMSLGLTNLTPTFSINNSFNDFSSNVAGTFSAEVIPEPTSMLLLGSGLVGIVAGVRRRMKSARKDA